MAKDKHSKPDAGGISWSRAQYWGSPYTSRPDILGYRTLGDGRRELLMHNKGLCAPYYTALEIKRPHENPR
jgi:hypothetical protein